MLRQRPAIRIHAAVDEIAAGSRHGFHDRALAPGGARVARKGDAGAIGSDHLLHEHRHGAADRIERELASIEQGGVGPERSPHHPHRIEHGFAAHEVHTRLVQPGKGAPLRVLGRR